MSARRADASGGSTIAGIVIWGGLTALTAAAGAAASVRSQQFYMQLDRPSWAPPPDLFGPVWTVLYVLMALAAVIVWRARGWSGARGALTLFIAQLVLNGLWTWLFFAMRNGMLAFVEILALLALIVATIIAFWRIRPVAGMLLLPYLAWVTFATALTWATWQGNRALLG